MSGGTVSVFGLGKLGAPMAAVFADAGYRVRGFDVSSLAVSSLVSSEPLSYEPELQALLKKNSSRLTAFTSANEALEGTEAAFVIVPTPSGQDGAFENTYVVEALRSIGNHLRLKPRPFTVVISSTVMPGSCASVFVPELESASGLEVGRSVGLIYSPEFIALGSVVRDMRYPDLVLIGESDSSAGAWFERFSLSVVKNQPAVKRMTLASAELSKIAINSFVTTKISFANMLSEMCENLDGADVDDVTSAVGADSRVGPKYLRSGLGFGGPCFPRDNRAIARSAELLGTSAEIPIATDAINMRQVDKVVSLALENSSVDQKVAVVGLAYKKDTSVTESSQGLEIAERIQQSGREVIGIDALVDHIPATSGLQGLPVTSDWTALRDSALVILANPVDEDVLIKGIIDLDIQKVIDLWGSTNSDHPNVIAPGRSYSGPGGE